MAVVGGARRQGLGGGMHGEGSGFVLVAVENTGGDLGGSLFATARMSGWLRTGQRFPSSPTLNSRAVHDAFSGHPIVRIGCGLETPPFPGAWVAVAAAAARQPFSEPDHRQ
jgi:hypothetical protein